MTLTYTDIFCGAGGSSIGLSEAGLELKLAANHWERAIETHSANFGDADHLLADVSNYDMRRLPRTDALWASPECTWHSPAGGRKRLRAQLDLLDDYVPTDGGVRSRATALDVIRAAEVHRYKVIIVENVVEFADWPLFDWWLNGLRNLGYTAQIVCVSSAHVGGDGNPWAPQWRDRIYVFCTAKGVPVPDVSPRPAAWCPTCDEVVAALQSWKRPDRRRVGKYGHQYLYRCPNGSTCRHQIVEPFVLPAAAAIDWTDLGTRIGDRARPLAAATIRRIEVGLRLFAQPMLVPAGGTWNTQATAVDEPMRTRTTRDTEGICVPPFLFDRRYDNGPDRPRLRGLDEPMGVVTAGGQTCDTLVVPPFALNVNHGGDDGRPYLVDAAPFAPRTTKIGDGIGAPFIAELRRNCAASPVDEPLSTVAAAGRHHGLVAPFLVKNYGGNCDPKHTAKPVDEPLSPITTRDHHALVVPYRRGHAKTTAEPLHALGTKDSAALVEPAIAVEDCRFRMLKPREHLRAQRFPDSYVVKGNQGEQTMQAGNAVSANVAYWLGRITIEALS